MKEVLLVSISGEDRPGITTAITEVLSRCGVQVLDLSQSVIHDQLALGLLVSMPDGADSSPMVKEVLYTAYDLGMRAKFTTVNGEDYESWVSEQGAQRHSIILLGRGLSATQISAVTAVIAEQNLNIYAIQRLSGRVDLGKPSASARSCVEFLARGTPHNGAQMREVFLELASRLGVDIAIQADDVYRRTRRLVCFDMDSTLIQTEVIDELAIAAGVGERVAAITESAMRGEIDFADSFRQRVALLKGLDASVLEEIAEKLPITEGAERLCSALKRVGYKLAILSGGFTFFGHYLQKKLGIDYVHANELDIVDGKLTGKHLGPIIDANAKAERLISIADTLGIRKEQTIAVGDGANDLAMLNTAGLGIAFHAKSLVKENTEHAISNLGLDAILYMIGLRDWQVDELFADEPLTDKNTA